DPQRCVVRTERTILRRLQLRVRPPHHTRYRASLADPLDRPRALDPIETIAQLLSPHDEGGTAWSLPRSISRASTAHGDDTPVGGAGRDRPPLGHAPLELVRTPTTPRTPMRNIPGTAPSSSAGRSGAAFGTNPGRSR